MRWISAERIDQLLDFPSLAAALEQAHRRGMDAMGDLLLSQTGSGVPDRHFLLRAAWKSELGIGAKLATVFPGNNHRVLPSVQAVYALFDAADGRPLACLDGTALTHWKTAADSALGAKLLARRDSRTLLMVGAGAMAPYLVHAHFDLCPALAEVQVWNRSLHRAVRLADSLISLGRPARVAPDLKVAVGEADIVCCATMATAPLIQGQWLRPGTHLDLVGAYTPEMREADDEAVRRASLFVDSRETAVHSIGELAIPLREGVIAEDRVLADLFDLCQGRHPGRQSADEITLFKNGGGGHLDLMTARFVLDRAGPQ
jgi:ornithine cyclodeaminase